MVHPEIFQAYERNATITFFLFSVRLVAGPAVCGAAIACIRRALARQFIGRLITTG